MKFLDNQTPQVDFDNIKAIFLAVMFTNKSEIVEMNRCSSISNNGETENNVDIFCFISVLYTLEEYVESGGNQLTSGDVVCNAIYISPGWKNHNFMLCKMKIIM